MYLKNERHLSVNAATIGLQRIIDSDSPAEAEGEKAYVDLQQRKISEKGEHASCSFLRQSQHDSRSRTTPAEAAEPLVQNVQ